jgi:hypothetical protein
MEPLIGLTEELISKVYSIIRSHPDGVTVEQMVDQYGFASSTVHAVLRVLLERDEVQARDLFLPTTKTA